MAAALTARLALLECNEAMAFAAQAGLKEKKLPFSFAVTAEAELNTLALPGLLAFVTWPLLAVSQGERDGVGPEQA
jgi:hypothetical protein